MVIPNFQSVAQWIGIAVALIDATRSENVKFPKKMNFHRKKSQQSSITA
jgi:hypothetical protein